MSQSFYKSSKKSRLSNKNSGKCGEITFCLQLGKRFYAMNCLFCPQICIQWDAFINHMEEEHEEDLRSDHLLQQEAEEANVDANSSNKTAPKRSSAHLLDELPQSSRVCVRTEFNDNTSAEDFLDYDDHLMGNDAEKRLKTEHYGYAPEQTFEIRVVNAAKSDQTCDSIDEQKTFDSTHSLSETDSDLDATNAQPNRTFLQPDKYNKYTPVTRNMSYVGDTEYDNLSQDNMIYNPNFLEKLPSTQEIKQIPELRTILKIDALENKHRTKLAKGLINFILYRQPERKMSKQDFFQLAQSIVEIFPSEVRETYYVPYKTGHKPKGKLFDAYYNTRTRLSVAGLIRRRVKSKPVDNNALGNGTACENENIEDTEEPELNILKTGCSEWDMVLKKWRETHHFRQRELKNQTLKTHEYIEKYKVLLHENNYELFDMDFRIIYPTTKNIYEWKLYHRKVISKAEKVRDNSVRDILAYINSAEDEDSKLALSMMLIGYVLPNPRQRTKVEIQECFISYCKNIIDADEESSQRTNRLQLEGHPKVYLVGDSSKTVCEAFVDVCGTRLKFENPMKAIEVCFYCFMVMNIKYPKYGAHVWMFIQKLLYDVDTPWDTVIPAINTLINDLRLDKMQH